MKCLSRVKLGISTYWQDIDRSVTNRINELLQATLRDPFKGIGKTQPLKGKLVGLWSRRMTGEYRFVYRCIGAGMSRGLKYCSAGIVIEGNLHKLAK